MSAILVLCVVALCPQFTVGEYTITIHPEYLAQGGRTRFEADRWDGHMGLDTAGEIPMNIAIGTESGRWNHRDFANDVFEKATEDPHKKGFPDPHYFDNKRFGELVASKYVDNLNGYGHDLDMVMEFKAKNWPHWMNTSLHKGTFPNDLQAATDMVLYLVKAVSRFADGRAPRYLEPVNEPDTLWSTVDWQTIIDYNRIVADNLRPVFPHMKFIGPATTGISEYADVKDFKFWKKMKDFLDMAFIKLDMCSFHAFSRVNVKRDSSHDWSGSNEARFYALVDLIENYAWKKTGRSIPILVSAYGLAGENVKVNKTTDFAEWAFGFTHNAHMFNFLNFRAELDRAIAFLLSKGKQFAGASILRDRHTYSHVAKVYQFWQHFNDSQEFLRVDSGFNGDERHVSPLALVNPHTKEIDVILHNYQQTTEQVNIKFDKHWTHSSSAKSTCFFRNSQNIPVLTEVKHISLVDKAFVLPAEGSCYLTIKSNFNFGSVPIVHESKYYATEMVIPISDHAVDAKVTIPSLNVRYANLRISVSVSDKTAQTKPKKVLLNGYALTSSYTLFGPGKQYSETTWDVHVFRIPTNVLRQHINAVHLQFAQNGGYVSSVVLITGAVSGDPAIIG